MSSSQSQCPPQLAYIITKNFNAPHIEQLIAQFNSKQIPVRLHNDYQTLGVPLDRRYFVVVDNGEGTVALSAWFTSLLLVIVGYPRKGGNRKNLYCGKPGQVVARYWEFCMLPQFVKKSFLSSKISSKAVLKSSRSFVTQVSKSIETFSNDNKNSQSDSKSLDKSPKVQLNEKSKLYLFAAQNDVSFNKWTLKIAASNPKKFEIVENQTDLNLALSVSRTKINFLLITSPQYRTINAQALRDLKIVIYQRDQENQEIKKSDNILGICRKQTEIIHMIREIGFQVVSLKDIDKSIVKYGNPFAKQVKTKSKKKILWGKQSESDKSCESDPKNMVKSVITKPETLYHITINSKQVMFPMTASAPHHKSFSSTSKIEEKQKKAVTPEKEKKRLSIESEVRKNQIQLQIVKANPVNQQQNMEFSVTKPIFSKIKSQEQRQESKIMVIEEKKDGEMESDIMPVSLVSAEKKAHRKIKRIRGCKSLHEKKVQNKSEKPSHNQYTSQPPKQIPTATPQKIEEFILKPQQTKDTSSESSFGHSATSNHILNGSKASFILKEQLRNSETLSFPQTVNLNTKNQGQAKQRKQRQIKVQVDSIYIEKPSITYRMRLLGAEESLLRRRVSRNSRIGEDKENIMEPVKDSSQFVLLWKEFNFQIENSKDCLLRVLKDLKMQSNSFYSPQQLNRVLEMSKKGNIIAFLDQIDIQKYADVLKNYLIEGGSCSIYIFEKEEKIKVSLLQKLRIFMKTDAKSQKIFIKSMQINDYTDGSMQTAKEISSWFIRDGKI